MSSSGRVSNRHLLAGYAAILLLFGTAPAAVIEFAGQVIDAERHVIKDAHVFLYEYSFSPDTGQFKRKIAGQTRTDSQGRFVFATDASPDAAFKYAFVLAAAPQRSILWVPWNLQEDKNAILQLADYDSIAGVVKDSQGRPVSGVTVRAVFKLPPTETENPLYCFDWLTDTTDVLGRFAFNFIPKNAVALLYIDDIDTIVRRDSFAHYHNIPFRYKAGDHTVELTIHYESQISGVCIGSDEKPLAGIKIHMSGLSAMGSGDSAAVTDGDGRFSMTARGGGLYSIYLSHSEVNKGWVAEPLNVFVGTGQDKSDVVLRVSRAALIEMHVEDSDKKQAIPDAIISMRRKVDGQSGFSAPLSFYSHGGRTEKTIYVPAGVYEYEAHARGYLPFVSPEELRVHEGESAALRVSLKPLPVLRGIVRDEAGKPVAEMELTALPGGDRTNTDQNGVFSIAYLPGENNLYLCGILEKGVDSVGVLQPFRNGQEHIELMAISTATINGSVINPAGEPVQNAHCSLYLVTGSGRVSLQTGGWTTDAEGSFSVAVVPGFFYQIGVFDNAHRSVLRGIDVPEKASPVTLTPFCLGIQTVTGTVIDDASKPVEGAEINVYDVLKNAQAEPEYSVRWAGRAVSDAAGRYVLDRIDPDMDAKHAMFVAVRDGYAIGVCNAWRNEEQIDPIVVESRPKHFSGRIVDSQGLPIAGAAVSAYVASYAAADQHAMTHTPSKLAQTESLRSLTDANGHFVISGVPRFSRGEFSVEAQGYSKLVTWDTRFGIQEATIPAGKENLVFILYKTSSIQGKVLEHAANIPIIGEKVFITPRMDAGAATVWSALSGTQVVARPEGNSFELLTNQQGAFASPNLSPGLYRVALDPFGSPLRRWSAIPLEIEVVEGQTASVELEAVRVGTVRVLVTEKDSRAPVAGARVALSLRETSTQPPNNAPPPVINLSSISFASAGQSPEDAELITLAEDGSARETVIPSRTDSDGVAELRVAPGVYVVSSVAKANYQWIPAEEAILAESDRTVNATVQMQPMPQNFAAPARTTEPRRDIIEPARVPLIVEDTPSVEHTSIAKKDDEPVFPIEIVLVDEVTREPIDYARASVTVVPDSGDNVNVSRDGEGRFRTRVKAGRCLVSADGYLDYKSTQNMEVTVYPDRENRFEVPIFKHPVIEGVVTLPDSVSIDDLVVDAQPNASLTIFPRDFKIAGDGEYSCKISVMEFSGRIPSHGWLWIRTKDHRYVSRTKLALRDGRLDIALRPDATVLFKKTPRHRSIMMLSVQQDEYDNMSTLSSNHMPDRTTIINNEEYFGLRGLIAGQEDLRYVVTVGNLYNKPIVINSKDITSGETVIFELPAQ